MLSRVKYSDLVPSHCCLSMLLAAVSLSWLSFPASLSCNPHRYVQNYLEKEKLSHRYWSQAHGQMDVCFFSKTRYFFLFCWQISWMLLAAFAVFRTCKFLLYWVILMIYSLCSNLLLWCCMFITFRDPIIRFGVAYFSLFDSIIFAADFCGIYMVLYHVRWAHCGQIHIYPHSAVFLEDCM